MNTAAAITRPLPRVRLKPSSGWRAVNLKELWQFRELIYFLSWRDVKVRYKQTALGASWAVLQPFMTMVVFSVFFGKLAKMPSDGIPYPIFAYAALVPWTFFANGLTQSGNSLIQSASMLKKVYFPRLIIPVSSVLSGLVDFLFAFGVLIALMLYYGYVPTLQIVWLPVFMLLAFGTALGVGLWLSAINVQFRDVRYTIPFITQFWLFSTPIAYPSSLLSEPWRTLYGSNPMVGVVEGFRWALLGTETSPVSMILLSAGVAGALLVTGLFYFKRMERSFADVV